jgi:hypothetical protein
MIVPEKNSAHLTHLNDLKNFRIYLRLPRRINQLPRLVKFVFAMCLMIRSCLEYDGDIDKKDSTDLLKNDLVMIVPEKNSAHLTHLNEFIFGCREE